SASLARSCVLSPKQSSNPSRITTSMAGVPPTRRVPMSKVLTCTLLAATILLCAGAGHAQTPDKRSPNRTDCYGDPLPQGVIARIGSIRLKQRTKNFESWVQFSPDSKSVAVTFSEHKSCGILLLDAKTGRVLRRLEVPGNVRLYKSFFSPDGKLLAVLAEKEVFVLETDREPAFGRYFKRGCAEHVAFLPDNKTLIVAGGNEWGDTDERVRLWDIQTGRAISRWKGSVSPEGGLRVSNDGKQLTIHGFDCIQVWDMAAKTLTGQRSVKPAIYAVSRNLEAGLLEHPFRSGTQLVWD